MFLGTKQKMLCHYDQLLLEFSLPYTFKYYLISGAPNEYLIVMTGLVGHNNLVAQLCTVALANIHINNITIIGNTTCLRDIICNDIKQVVSTVSNNNKLHTRQTNNIETINKTTNKETVMF